MTLSLSRRIAAETLGTLLLVATVVGSGIMAERLAGGNVGLALLGNTIATGAMLIVLITLFGPLSGAHFNPVVTLVMGMQSEIKPREAFGYVAAQVGGGLAGTWLAHAMFALPILQLSAKMRSGPAQWLSEAVATFALLLAILLGRRVAPQSLPMLVGLTIVGAYWFTASTSFANPAVTIARGFSATFAGIDPAHVLAFIAAQVAGAVLAAGCARWFLAAADVR